MFFLKTVRSFLGISISAAAVTVLLAGIAAAGEISGTVLEKPSSEAAAAPPLTSPAVVETVTVTGSGTCYRIDANNSACYEKPKAYGFLINAPLNIVDWLKESFQQKNALAIAGLAAATAGLIAVDQDLYRVTHDAGRSLNISADDRMKGKISIVPGYPIEYPTNFGAALYFLGDGMIPLSITAGMFGYGLSTSDVRSLVTSSQMAEGLISVGIVVQALKRTTGRQTPGRATSPGGKWQFFPNFNDYNKHTPSYDAFPSGHLATAMMTITVLSDNYPEYTLIKPVGYFVMTLIGFQMINNGVHWASDYPIAIAMGYGLGKVAVSHGRKVVSTGDAPEKASKHAFIGDITMLPVPLQNGGAVVVAGSF